MLRIKFIFLISIAVLVFFNSSVSAQPENSCVDCHKKPEIISSLPEWQQENFAEWQSSIHAREGVTCEKCHGGDPAQAKKELSHEGIKNSSSPESPIYYKNVPETCGTCHAGVYDEFKRSLMFHNLETDKLAPSCATCMGSHDVALVDALKISKKCSICHNELMGIKPEIPDEARKLLLLQEQVKSEILKAQSTIEATKGMGKDTAKAEKALQEAISRLEKSGSEWHRFRISGFEGEMLDALYYAYKANNLVYEALTEIPSTTTAPAPTPKKGICGPTAVLLIAMLPPVFYGLRKRL